MRYSKSAAKFLAVPALAILLIFFFLPFAFGNPNDRSQERASETDKDRIRAAFENMPLHFIENRGQLDRRVAYCVQARNAALYFNSQGVTFALTDKTAALRYALKLDFLNANADVKLKAQYPTPAAINFFNGGKEQWRTGLAGYATLVYEDLWPGINLVYSGSAGRLKYSFVVEPGADPSLIKLAYRGAASINLNDAGQLEIATPAGGFRDDKPYSYQDSNGKRVEVATAYWLEESATRNLQPAIRNQAVFSFRIGDYDKSKPLVIDPDILLYSSYMGGSGDERALAIALDGAGNAYITGATASADFPAAAGQDLSFKGVRDAFVAKMNAAGTAMVYCAYIGGSGDDAAFDIAVDKSGNAYITGATSSSDFPVKGELDPTYNGGDFDAFAAKLNAAGTDLIYCGYIGGSGTDGGVSIALSGGNSFITGGTNSNETTFPATIGPDLTFNGGTIFGDAFVAEVDAKGESLIYCGYIGGAGEDAGIGIAVDIEGNAYITGGTNSDEATFPVKTGPDLKYNGGLHDAFAAKVSPTGASLIYCGYIGGSNSDTGFGIAVDGAGNAYIAGETYSTEETFPVKTGPDLTHNGKSDAFITKVNSKGESLIYCGYIGGDGRDGAVGVAVDGGGNAYITGATSSTEKTFPANGGADLTFNGGGFLGDAFLAKTNAKGTALIFCGYIGGEDDDIGYSVAIDDLGNAYVAGETGSADFPAIGRPDLTYGGGVRDGFVMKFGDISSAPGCARRQSFWKTHPNSYPTESLMMGGQIYNKSELLNILNAQTRGDASMILGQQLIAAKLNIVGGSASSSISAALADADKLLTGFKGKLPYNLDASSEQGRKAVSLSNALDRYNNGALAGGPSPCD